MMLSLFVFLKKIILTLFIVITIFPITSFGFWNSWQELKKDGCSVECGWGENNVTYFRVCENGNCNGLPVKVALEDCFQKCKAGLWAPWIAYKADSCNVSTCTIGAERAYFKRNCPIPSCVGPTTKNETRKCIGKCFAAKKENVTEEVENRTADIQNETEFLNRVEFTLPGGTKPKKINISEAVLFDFECLVHGVSAIAEITWYRETTDGDIRHLPGTVKNTTQYDRTEMQLFEYMPYRKHNNNSFFCSAIIPDLLIVVSSNKIKIEIKYNVEDDESANGELIFLKLPVKYAELSKHFIFLCRIYIFPSENTYINFHNDLQETVCKINSVTGAVNQEGNYVCSGVKLEGELPRVYRIEIKEIDMRNEANWTCNYNSSLTSHRVKLIVHEPINKVELEIKGKKPGRVVIIGRSNIFFTCTVHRVRMVPVFRWYLEAATGNLILSGRPVNETYFNKTASQMFLYKPYNRHSEHYIFCTARHKLMDLDSAVQSNKIHLHYMLESQNSEMDQQTKMLLIVLSPIILMILLLSFLILMNLRKEKINQNARKMEGEENKAFEFDHDIHESGHDAKKQSLHHSENKKPNSDTI